MSARLAGCPLLLAVALAGCAAGGASGGPTPPTAQEFENMRAALAASPEARAAVEVECQDDVAQKPAADRAAIGALLDLDPDAVVAGYCARMVAGFARGDLSYGDFVAMSEGSTDPQLLRRFIRTLRLDPSAQSI
jgi:hypothetical protein